MIRIFSPTRLCHFPAAAVCGLILLVAASCVTPQATPMRGKLIPEKTQVNTLDHKPGMMADLIMPPGGNAPALRIRTIDTITLQKTVFFEKWLEYRNAGENSPVVRTEFMAGKYLNATLPPETETRLTGPLKGQTVELNGTPFPTTSDGICTGSPEFILRQFDALSLELDQSVSIQIVTPALGSSTIQVTREKLFGMLGVQWSTLPRSTYDGLALSATSEWTSGGLRVTATVTNTNASAHPAAMVVGRLFSREPWLDGRFFYFGNLAPGAKSTFSRTFAPPAGRSLAATTAVLSLWNPNADDASTPRVQAILRVAPPPGR